MSLRDELVTAIEAGRFDTLEDLVAANPRTVRYLVGMSFLPDATLSEAACRGIGFAARHHPKLMRNVIQRQVSALSGEGGNNGASAPALLEAIAGEQPELLLPMLPDLLQLSADPELRPKVVGCLQLVAKGCPDAVSGHIKSMIVAAGAGSQ